MNDKEILAAYQEMMHALISGGKGKRPTDEECLRFLGAIVKQWTAWRSMHLYAPQAPNKPRQEYFDLMLQSDVVNKEPTVPPRVARELKDRVRDLLARYTADELLMEISRQVPKYNIQVTRQNEKERKHGKP